MFDNWISQMSWDTLQKCKLVHMQVMNIINHSEVALWKSIYSERLLLLHVLSNSSWPREETRSCDWTRPPAGRISNCSCLDLKQEGSSSYPVIVLRLHLTLWSVKLWPLNRQRSVQLTGYNWLAPCHFKVQGTYHMILHRVLRAAGCLTANVITI